jgi:glycosyltransferase involved in cell wall biosynthesis
VIVGDGYYTDEYVAFVKSLAANIPSIIFTGFQSGVPLHTLYSHAHLMVHPSDNEGLPICVLEGMSYSLPILLSNIVEHRDLVSNDKFFFERGNVNSLVKKLSNIVSMDESEIKKEGLQNRALIEKEFSWESVMDSIVEVYGTPLAVPAIKTVSV